MISFEAKSEITVTQIDSPHKFWYKKCNDPELDQQLAEFEDKIAKYAADLIEWNEQLPINRGDEVVAFHSAWNKWIRGKAGKLISGSKTDIFIWAIDYGCKLMLPLKNVYLLQDQKLAFNEPINLQIGGLIGISPAKPDFNIDNCQSDTIRCDEWTSESIQKFTECVENRKRVTFHVDDYRSKRNFGQLVLHCENGTSNTFSVNNGLCEWRLAMQNKNYKYDIWPLEREDFLRLNHQLTAFRMAYDNEDDDDEIAKAERIFLNGSLSSLDMVVRSEDEVDCSKQQKKQSSKQPYSHVSSSLAISGINENSLSEETNTLSVKLLNKLNVLIITSDEVTPVEKWNEIGFFTNQTKTFLMQFYRQGFDRQCSYAWPHIMRTNSMFLIDEPMKNLMMCLPTVCSIKQTISTWSTDEFLDSPIAIIFVTCAEEVNKMAKCCRKLLQKSGQMDVNVFCLNSSFEIGVLEFVKKDQNIDILVAPVFCFETIAQNMPKLTTRLRYVWFHQIDEMCEINEELTYNATDQLILDDLDIQIVTTSKSYCPILNDLFDRAKIPMISIGDRSPFEAALFAKCLFTVKFAEHQQKIRNMIEKLQYRLSGSIVIMCADQTDVEIVTGHLTQANIKCIDLDNQYSKNQLKLIKWSKRCLSVETQSSSNLNILVCDDKTLAKLPIRSGQHIIHYSLPQKLQTFKQRYITCYGFYEDRLRRKLLYQENDLTRPISHVYFDDKFVDEYIEIFELLLNRAKFQPPSDLIKIVQEMRFNFEASKMKPVCIDLITRSVDCDMQCPYRHTLYSNCNATSVPECGYVNMQLLGVLAPNHFAVRVNGHKRRLENKTKSVECLNYDWEQFDKKLREHYGNVSHQIHDPIEIGDMCWIFHQSQPKRCRVISMEKDRISVYLVDIGRIRSYAPDQLYRLDDEFQDFPTQAIEVFVLGYLPSDSNPKWLPETKKYVESMMHTMKEQRKTQNYLQAEVIKAFERTLIVKDLRILYKGKNQLRAKSIGRNLIKSGWAVEAPILLHDIFMDDIDDATENYTINSEIIDNTVMPTINSRYAMQLSRPPSSDGIRVTSLENYENPPDLKLAYSKIKRHSESTTPASLGNGGNGVLNSDAGIDTNLDEPEWDATDDKINNTNEVCMNAENEHEPVQELGADVVDAPFINFDVHVASNGEIIDQSKHMLSLDEIFGSLPECIQSTDVLQPIRCHSNGPSISNENLQMENEITNWLIDFSD